MQSEQILRDQWGRVIDYVRLSLTDVCNLRCVYCMPENMRFMPSAAHLTLSEMTRLVRILARVGIRKMRITGGEPTLHPQFADIMQICADTPTFKTLHLTTNGVLLGQYLDWLSSWRIQGVNLSVDTLRSERFMAVTRRDSFHHVQSTFDRLMAMKSMDQSFAHIQVKMNVVVMGGINTDELHDFCALTKDLPIDVRFIEQMPFNGEIQKQSAPFWDYHRILGAIQERYTIQPLQDDDAHATAMTYAIPGHRGRIGVIAGYSRTFCGTCNRLRITADGMVQTCLYDRGTFSIRDALRSDASDEDIIAMLHHVVAHKSKNGRIAEERSYSQGPYILPSMAVIGG